MADSPNDRTPVMLSPEAFARTREAVKFVERMDRGKTSRADTTRTPWTIPIRIAKATASISARSGAVCGHGSAKFQKLSTYTLSDATDTVTVLNITDKTIASGAYLIIVWALARWWVVVVGSCANLS